MEVDTCSELPHVPPKTNGAVMYHAHDMCPHMPAPGGKGEGDTLDMLWTPSPLEHASFM